MIKLVGDINFTDGFFDTGFGIGSSIKKGGSPFKYLSKNIEDIWIGNLECVVSTESNKKGIYKKQFLIEPSYLDSIHFIDIYNVANNHIMQHGEVAYNNTTRFLEKKNLHYFGCSNNKTTTFQYKGKKIAVLGFSQRDEKFSKNPKYWYNPEYTEIITEFNKIKENDFKIAYLHWGNEFIDRPYNDQKKLARWMVDLGFDLIIGLHPHVLQGYEIYKGKYIYYSLGNFVFNMPLESTRYSCIVNLDFKNNQPVLSEQYVIIGTDNFPKLIADDDVPISYKFEYLNSKIIEDVENEVYYNKVNHFLNNYRKANYKFIIQNLFNYRLKDVINIFADYIKRRF